MNSFKDRKDKINLYQRLRKVLFTKDKPLESKACPQCNSKIVLQQLIENDYTCTHCNYLLVMPSNHRIKSLVDLNSFKEIDKRMKTNHGQMFEGYQNKLDKAMKQSHLNEAYVYGSAKVNQHKLILGVMDAQFMMGSMGYVVGEKITRSIELATKMKVPFVIVTASGGARMQEGILSLVQMSKTTNALAHHSEKGLLSISILTNPTTGGVSASFAMTCDIVLAEPKATIGFAGKRVIAQTINEALPEDFQSSESQLEHGFIDRIVPRHMIREDLSLLLALHTGEQL